MNISTRQRDDVVILEPKGKITIGSGDIALRNAVHTAFDDGSKRILVNLDRASRIDSSGMGELVAAYNWVASQGGSLKLLHLPTKLQDVFTITQLISVFEIFDDEEQALGSFH